MCNIVEKISQRMINSGMILPEEKDIYSYGLECFFLKITHIVSYLLIGVLTQCVKELLIILFVVIPLRENAGGFHAKTRTGCYILSCSTILGGLIIYKFVSNMIFYYLLAGFSVTVLLVLAPIDNENKKFNLYEKNHYRIRTIQVFMAVIVILGVAIYFNEYGLVRLCVIGIIIVSLSLIAGKIRNKKVSKTKLSTN